MRVDHRKLADQGTGAEDGQNALAAGRRHDRDLQQPLLDTIAAVTRVTGGKQHLVRLETMRPRAREQRGGQFGGKNRQDGVGRRGRLRHEVLVAARMRRHRITHRVERGTPRTSSNENPPEPFPRAGRQGQRHGR